MYWKVTLIVCETKRLIIRHFELSDDKYILAQLNEASFIKSIGDKHVRSLDDAQNYLITGPIDSYQKLGFGLNIVMLKQNGMAIGMCGLVTRAELEHPDIGYAFLPNYWGKGYATEASKAVLDDAITKHKLKTILGVTFPENQSSNSLLSRIGFNQIGSVELYDSINNLYMYQSNS